MKKLLAILAVVGVTSLAQADLLIEPYLGYESGAQTAKFKDGTTIDFGAGPISLTGVSYAAKQTGMMYGARLGYTFAAFLWLAVDYSTGTIKHKVDNTTLFADYDATRTSTGLTLGFDFPILVRAWVGYNFSETLKNKYTYGEDEYKGTGTKIGVGFTGLPFVSINLEYFMRKYTEASGATYTNGLKFDQFLQNYENNGLMLSVSLPLEI